MDIPDGGSFSADCSSSVKPVQLPAMNVEPLNSPGLAESTPTASRQVVIPVPVKPVQCTSHASSGGSKPDGTPSNTDHPPTDRLTTFLVNEFRSQLTPSPSSTEVVSRRFAAEVARICSKSDRIQSSGQINNWQLTLAKHRLQKCLAYYQLGSRRGRVELHSTLSAMVYRHIAQTRSQLGFQARYNLIEDFLQGFYIEVMKAFRRENEMPEDYTPRTRLELAEYMTFAEHYAKRRITLPGQRNQQLIVLRAQNFARRQPIETSVDIELAMESARVEDSDPQHRSPLLHQMREQMVTEVVDPAEAVLRDRVVQELIEYLESQGQTDCVDYLTLKMQDLSVPEIDEVLGLSPRQRDYLQQRFKYHVEKFARSHRWQLVHQWLGADVDQNLGMSKPQWNAFLQSLAPDQRHLLELKQSSSDLSGTPRSDEDIAKRLKCTPKQVHKRWVKLLELAWQFRNRG